MYVNSASYINLQKNAQPIKLTISGKQPVNLLYGYSSLELAGLYNRVSFKANNNPPETTQAVEFIQKNKVTNLFSLKEDSLEKIKYICKGISVFENLERNPALIKNGFITEEGLLTAKGLQFITKNFDSILLVLGCSNNCSHCGQSAVPPISKMKWENYVELVDGISELKKRLGFNPFAIKFNEANLDSAVYPFVDAEPFSYEESGHDIYDAAKLYYSKTGTKFIITTAGRSPRNIEKTEQTIQKMLKDPNPIGIFGISIHSFHGIMQKSFALKAQGKEKEAEEMRERYIDMISKTIKASYGLRNKINKYGLILEYLCSSETQYLHLGRKDSLKLLEDILKKLEKDGMDLSYFINKYNKHRLNINNLTHAELRDIKLIGRATQYNNETNTEKRNKRKYELFEFNYMPKMIAPDGQILVRPDAEISGELGEFARIPFKLNFQNPNIDRSLALPEISLT